MEKQKLFSELQTIKLKITLLETSHLYLFESNNDSFYLFQEVSFATTDQLTEIKKSLSSILEQL